MKSPNKQDLQQVVFNHSSDIDFQDFTNLYKKCTGKPWFFLVIDAAVPETILYVSERMFRKNVKNLHKK